MLTEDPMSSTVQVPSTDGLTLAHLVVMLFAGVILWTMPVMLGTMAYWHFVADACR